jgi:hypothetical protein
VSPPSSPSIQVENVVSNIELIRRKFRQAEENGYMITLE